MVFYEHDKDLKIVVAKDLIQAALKIQSQRLFNDTEEGFKAMGPEIYAIFANFSAGEISDACLEAEKQKVDFVSLEAVKVSKAEAAAAVIEAAKVAETKATATTEKVTN
jgi:hypothetical protein